MYACQTPFTCSVTRFGKILPLWQKFSSIWQIFNGLFLIWQNAEPTLAIFGQFFIVSNGQILKNNLTIGSHCESHDPHSCWLQQQIKNGNKKSRSRLKNFVLRRNILVGSKEMVCIVKYLG